MDNLQDTQDVAYTNRLITKEAAWWKQLLDVQRPYRKNLESLDLGFVLEVGCGIGRNLKNLAGKGVGVDHNAESVATARERGFEAFTPDGFKGHYRQTSALFDSLLLAHVIEHMTPVEATSLIQEYLPFIKRGGKILFITPQESGYRSDASHVAFADFNVLKGIADACHLTTEKYYSFPFPRFVGKFFKYNEFIYLCRKQ